MVAHRGFKLSPLWILLLLVATFSIVVAVLRTGVPRLPRGQFLVGLLPSRSGSALVTFDPATLTFRSVRILSDVSPNNYAALSGDGAIAAFTKWNAVRGVRYLAITSGSGRSHAYLQHAPSGTEVEYVSWVPTTNLFVALVVSNRGLPDERVVLVDSKTHKLHTVAKGGVWKIIATEIQDGVSHSKTLLSQSQYNDVVEKYGGTPVPLSQSGYENEVVFSAPETSRDGRFIAYSATLNKVTAPVGQSVFVGSGIWLYDMSTGRSRLVIRASADTAFGGLTWVGANRLAVLNYRNANGFGAAIELFNVGSGHIRTLVRPTTTYVGYYSPLALTAHSITCIAVDAHGRGRQIEVWVSNPSHVRAIDAIWNGKPVLLGGFSLSGD